MSSAENWITVRLWFRKTGRARYISHLDLNRCMTRAVQRAKIPLWYTEGFNPHPFLTFALPLSLGIDGVRESMDIRLIEDVPEAELIEKINAGLPMDIRLFARTEPVMKPGKIASASFTMALEPETGSVDDLQTALQELLSQEQIIVPKKTKSGIKDLDIKPFLDLRNFRKEDGVLHLEAILPAGSTQNINPQLLLDALQKEKQMPVFSRIVRTNLYNGEGEVFA